MRGVIWVHESLKIRPPPLGQCITNDPLIIDGIARELCADWAQALRETGLEALNLIVFRFEIVTGKLEECIRDLKHQNVGVVVLVADEDTFAGSAHAKLLVVLL